MEKSTHKAVCVFTARGHQKILDEGGSQAWVLDAHRAEKHDFVVCVQNRGFKEDWGKASASHKHAFLVGRLRDVVPSEAKGRWLLRFSEYAVVDVANAWPGFRNPVMYTDLESMDIPFDTLKFKPMPSPTVSAAGEPLLTIAEAKVRLARTFSVSPKDIQITVNG